MRLPEPASEPGGAPLRLAVVASAAPMVPPGVVVADVSWQAAQACEVLDAYVYLEQQERLQLVGGRNRSTVERRQVVVTGGATGLEQLPAAGIRLDLAGSLPAGDGGSAVVELPVDLPQPPSVTTPTATLSHAVVAVVHVAELAPVEARAPVRFVLPPDLYAELAHRRPDIVTPVPGVTVTVDLDTRQVTPGQRLAGTLTATGTGPGSVASLALVRAAYVGSVANADAQLREDEVVDALPAYSLEADPAVSAFTLRLPRDAPPTFLAPGAAVRWFVRAEVVTPAAGVRRLLGGAPRACVVEYEVVVYEPPPGDG